MLFTIKNLKDLFPNYQGNLDENKEIQYVNTDSRIEQPNSLFIPIIGENFDGHQFAKEAIAGGAIALLWDKAKNIPKDISENVAIFIVEDTTDALQYLSSWYREFVDPIVIGITGSNGKTTTKDLVASVVKEKYKTHYTMGNLNNHIGLPLTILSMERNTEALVLEMGMIAFGEIDLLTRIAKPDFAIITNIGESHIEFLGSKQGIAKAKLEIKNGLKSSGKLIIDGDEPLLEGEKENSNTITCGFNKDNDVVNDKIEITNKETLFTTNNENYRIPLLGKHHAKNATFATEIARLLDVAYSQRKHALLNVQHTSMRFEMVTGQGGVSIINDTYNASPTSMKAAIQVVKEMQGFKEKVLILGDVLELGEHSEKLHRGIAEVIEPPITVVFTYGDEAKYISDEMKEKNIKTKHFVNREDLVEALKTYLNDDSLLLFKASRGLQFELFIKEIMND